MLKKIKIEPNSAIVKSIKHKTFTPANISVSLSLEPLEPVTIKCHQIENSKYSITPSFLRFDRTNWNVAQKISVSLKQNASAAKEEILTLKSDSNIYSCDLVQVPLKFESSLPDNSQMIDVPNSENPANSFELILEKSIRRGLVFAANLDEFIFSSIIRDAGIVAKSIAATILLYGYCNARGYSMGISSFLQEIPFKSISLSLVVSTIRELEHIPKDEEIFIIFHIDELNQSALDCQESNKTWLREMFKDIYQMLDSFQATRTIIFPILTGTNTNAIIDCFLPSGLQINKINLDLLKVEHFTTILEYLLGRKNLSSEYSKFFSHLLFDVGGNPLLFESLISITSSPQKSNSFSTKGFLEFFEMQKKSSIDSSFFDRIFAIVSESQQIKRGRRSFIPLDSKPELLADVIGYCISGDLVETTTLLGAEKKDVNYYQYIGAICLEQDVSKGFYRITLPFLIFYYLKRSSLSMVPTGFQSLLKLYELNPDDNEKQDLQILLFRFWWRLFKSKRQKTGKVSLNLVLPFIPRKYYGTEVELKENHYMVIKSDVQITKDNYLKRITSPCSVVNAKGASFADSFCMFFDQDNKPFSIFIQSKRRVNSEQAFPDSALNEKDNSIKSEYQKIYQEKSALNDRSLMLLILDCEANSFDSSSYPNLIVIDKNNLQEFMGPVLYELRRLSN